MSRLSPILILILSAAAFPSMPAFAGPYLHEVLNHTLYLASWNALFSGEKELDPWLVRYAQTRDGPATPGEVVQVDGNDYQINFVCKAHDCADNRFFLLFTLGGSKAWGYLVRNGKEERFFGMPDGDKMNALRVAAKGS